MNGDASDQQIYDFLTLLSVKGEASDEIAGGVYVLSCLLYTSDAADE